MSNNHIKTVLTQSKLKELLNYDKYTGIFTWRTSRGNRIKAGDVAGSKNNHGYFRIRITILSISKSYLLHRLAWLYVYGIFPREHLDHVNHDRTDNKISNLREATQKHNCRNASKSKNNKSGFNGVSWCEPVKKWQTQIQVNGKLIYIGSYKDKNEAICARLHANRLYKFHANHGKEV